MPKKLRTMAMTSEEQLRFVPSKVTGIPNVSMVAVFPDRLELMSNGAPYIVRLADIAEWKRPAWLWRSLAAAGHRQKFLPVGERNWFRPPSERFITFFTQPRITIYMPDEDPDLPYGETVFRRIQDIMIIGGFATWDLG